MKRCYFGAGLLAVLLVLGCLTAGWMGSHHEQLARSVKKATELALSGEAEQALALTRQAKAGWEDKRSLSAALADHEPMEHVDSLFAQLEAYAGAGEYVAFAAGCSQLASELEAMAEEARLTWWNLL